MADAEKLNQAQQRRLYATCQYIDGLLCDMEQILHEPKSPSAFPRHILDLSADQVAQVERHIRHIRAQLMQTLDWQALHPEMPEIPASRAILSNLSFIDIAVEELKPKYMRGSGAVPEGAAEGLNGVVRDLRSTVRALEHWLRQESFAGPNHQQEA